MHRDSNVNGVFDQGDTIEVREYDPILNKVNQNSFYSDEGLTLLTNRYTYEFNEVGNYTIATQDWSGDGKLNSLMFTSAAGHTPANHTENITLWDDAKFAERSTITQIVLQNSTSIESTVVLDQASLAKFATNRFYIFGGEADDKVILLNGKEDFTQTQDNARSGNRIYDVYYAFPRKRGQKLSLMPISSPFGGSTAEGGVGGKLNLIFPLGLSWITSLNLP